MTRATVLVVDDDLAFRATLAVLIRVLDYAVLVAPDVSTAKALWLDHRIDLVLSDLRMPGGSGIELLEWIGRKGHDTPVIIMSADEAVGATVEAMNKGAFDFIHKPFDVANMEALIGRALRRGRH